MSAWTSWSLCSSGCGKGWSTRTRSIVTSALCNGKACGSRSEKKQCTDYRENRDCVVSCKGCRDHISNRVCFRWWTLKIYTSVEKVYYKNQLVFNVFACFKQVEVERYYLIQTKFSRRGEIITNERLKVNLILCFFKVNSWGSWGACNEKCAVGSKKRTRTVKISKRCQGKGCPTLQVSIHRWDLERKALKYRCNSQTFTSKRNIFLPACALITWMTKRSKSQKSLN